MVIMARMPIKSVGPLKRIIALGVVGALLLTTPGLECYAAAARVLGEKAASYGIPQTGAPVNRALRLARPLPALDGAGASAGEASRASNVPGVPAGLTAPENPMRNSRQPALEESAAADGEFWDQRPAQAGAAPQTAGAAFGVGDNASVAHHEAVNAAVLKAISDRKARVAHQSDPQASGDIPAASAGEQSAAQTAVQALSQLPTTPGVAIAGLGTVDWKQGLQSLARIVAVAAAQPALRYLSVGDFQVSHVGFGPDHNTQTLYLDSRLLDGRTYEPETLTGVLANDLFELQARAMAKSSGTPWTPELSRRVHVAARELAEAVKPGLTAKVQGAVQSLVLSSPSIQKDQVERELRLLGLPSNRLPQELGARQAFVNRAAALAAKGFAAQGITRAMIEAQADVDALLEEVHPERLDTGVRSRLAELRRSAPEDFARMLLDAREYAQNVLDQKPGAQRPGLSAHSEVSGLAFRVQRALSSDEDVKPILAQFDIDAEAVESVWSVWSHQEETSELATVSSLAQSGSSLPNELEAVRKKVLSEEGLLNKEMRRLGALAKNQPMGRALRAAKQKLSETSRQLQEQSKGILAERKLKKTKALRRSELLEQSRRINAQLAALRAARAEIDARIKAFNARVKSEPMAALSLAVRRWFPKAQGFSVAGDALWDGESKELGALLLSPEEGAPQNLDSGIMDELAPKSWEVRGTQVGARWLKTRSQDWYRNRLLARHAFMGVSLWGSSLNGAVHHVPARELWPWAVEEIARAEAALSSPRAGQLDRALSHIQLASSLLAALDLGLGEDADRILQAVAAAQAGTQAYRASPGRQRTFLVESIQELRNALGRAAVSGRRKNLEDYLEQAFSAKHLVNRVGQLGIVGAVSSEDKPAHLATAEEARARLKSRLRESKRSADAEEKLNSILQSVAEGNDRFWEKFPQHVPLDKAVVVDHDAFGRPIEVILRAGKSSGPLKELLLIAPLSPGRYEAFVDEALFAMDPMAGRALVSALFRYFYYLKRDATTLNEAREEVNGELDDYHINPELTDRELLDRAVADYEAGIRVESLSGLSAAGGEENPQGIAQAMRLAQAFADFVHAPQSGLNGEVLVAWSAGNDDDATRAVRAKAEKIVEVLAGNGMRVQLVEKTTSASWMSYAMLQGPFMAGILVNDEDVHLFGHDHGALPASAMDQIRAMEALRASVWRMNIAMARLKKLVKNAQWWEDYQNSLQRKFRIEQIQKSGLRLDIDSRRGEDQVIFGALGLLAGALDNNGSEELLARRVAQAAGKRLGAIFKPEDGVQILDRDGGAVAAEDLSLVFNSYLIERSRYQGPIYRTFAQTRLLDRLAQRAGVPLEEIDLISEKTDPTDLILSPFTPWNDPYAQVLLAMEIVAVKGKGLRQLARELRGELGADISSFRKDLDLPAAVIEALWRKQDDSALAGIFSQKLQIPVESVQVRFMPRTIQVSVGAQDWLYLKRSGDRLSIYAESLQSTGAQAMVAAAQSYVYAISKDWGPSRASRLALVVWSGILLGFAGLVGVTFAAPALFTHMPIIGHFLSSLIDLGSKLLSFFRPPAFGVLGKILASGMGRALLTVPVFFTLEFGIYWLFFRLPLWFAKYAWERPLKPLTPEMQSMPLLGPVDRNPSTGYFFVGIQKDFSLGIIRSAAQRLRWRWMQVLYYAYQAESLIMTKLYDDKMFTLRQPINAKGRMLAKAVFLEPKIWWQVEKDLWAANRAPIAGRGLPAHISPITGVPLPEPLRGAVRAEFGMMKRTTDGDTPEVQLVSGDRWGRAKGFDAVENGKAGAKKAKQLLSKLLRGKKTLFLIPQVQINGRWVDEIDDYGRFLFYAYVKDEKNRWFNVNLYILNELGKEKLVNIRKGAPDAYILPYYHLEVAAPEHTDDLLDNVPVKPWAIWRLAWWKKLWRRWFPTSQALAPAAAGAPAAVPETAPAQAPRPAVLDDSSARSVMGGLGARVDAQARLVLSAEFAGQQGERLAGRMGRVTMEPASQLIITGSGIQRIGAVAFKPGASLQLQTPGSPAAPARGRIADSVIIDGNVEIRVEEGARLDIAKGVRFSGYHRIVVAAGSRTVVKMVDGQVDVRSDHSNPNNFLNRVWRNLERGGNLQGLATNPTAQGMDFGKIENWWRRGENNRYGKVRIPQKSGLRGIVSKMQAPLDHRGSLPRSRAEGQSFIAGRRAPADKIAAKYLMRSAGFGKERSKAKQLLLAGLQQYLQVQENLEKERMEKQFAAAKAPARRALEAKRAQKKLDKMRQQSQGVLGIWMDQVATRLADLRGFLYWGPLLFPDSVSVIASGPYFWSAEDKRLELLVIRSGAKGPEVAAPDGLAKLPLPNLRELRVVVVGEDWLKENSTEANRLLTRHAALGITVWGRDWIGVTSRISQKVPARNLLALVRESLDEAETDFKADASKELLQEKLKIARLLLISVAPATADKPDGDGAKRSAAQLIAQARRNHRRVEQWILKEELGGMVADAVERAAPRPSLGGVAGLLSGDFTQGRPWHSLSPEQSIAWVRALMSQGAGVQEASRKLEEAFSAARSKRAWWEWFPQRLEADHFVSIGTGPLGRPIEVRVTVRRMPIESSPRHFVAYAIARSDSPDRVVDTDRYELVLDDVFGWAPEARDLVFKNMARQLSGLLRGESLNQIREAAANSGEDVEAVGRAVAEHEKGIQIISLEKRPTIPWAQSGWKGELGAEDVLRTAQGIARYISRSSPERRRRVLISYAAGKSETARLAGQQSALKMAEVFAGNGIESAIEDPASSGAGNDFTGLQNALKASSFDLGIGIAPEEIRVVGKGGEPLAQTESNRVVFEILRANAARALELDIAHKRNLIQPAAVAAAAPASGEALAASAGEQPEMDDLADAAAAPQRPSAVVSVPPTPTTSLARTATIYWALLIQSLVLVMTIGQPILAVIFPAILNIFPQYFIAYNVVKSMVFLRFVFVDSPFFIGWLAMVIPAGFIYFLNDRIKYWLTPEGESDLAPWWSFWSFARWKKIFLGGDHAVEKEIDSLPKAANAASRGQGFEPTQVLLNGTVAVREKNLAAANAVTRLLVYLYSVAQQRLLNGRLMGFLIQMGGDLIIARYRVARVTFFVVTFPFWFYWIWRELVGMAWKRLAGQPIDLRYRVQGEVPERRLDLPKTVRENFKNPELVRIQVIKDDKTLLLEDGRSVRLINAGPHGRGVAALNYSRAKNFLEGKRAWLLAPRVTEDGTRNEAVHLFLAEGEYEDHPINAVYALASQLHWYADGKTDPFARTWVDMDKLPLVLSASLREPEFGVPGRPASSSHGTLVRVIAGITLAAILGSSLALFAALAPWPHLSTLAHMLGWTALSTFGAASLYGLYRTAIHKAPGMLLRHTTRGLALASALLYFTIRLIMPGDGFAQAPFARSVARHAVSIMDTATLLPQPPLSVPTGGRGISLAAKNFALDKDHPLTQSVRDLFDPLRIPYFADQVEVHGPAELDAKYKFVWAYSPYVSRRNPDGDNAWLQDGTYLRYLGINAPETAHGDAFDANEGPQPYGKEAEDENHRLVLNHRVLVAFKKDGGGKDSYNRSLSYVWAPVNPADPNSRLVSVQVELLKWSNQRYADIDPLILNEYRSLDPQKDLTYHSTARPRGQNYPVLDLDPVAARVYYANQPPAVIASRWSESGNTPELELSAPVEIKTSAGPSVKATRLRLAETSLFADPQKRAAAWKLIKDRVGRGQEIRFVVSNWRVVDHDTSKPLPDINAYIYVPSRTDPGVYENLNFLIFDQGLNSRENGTPDWVTLRKTHLLLSNIDYGAWAGRVAQSPLQALEINNPELIDAYKKRMESAKPPSRNFQAALSLLAQYARNGLLAPAQQEALLRSLLAGESDPESLAWIQGNLVPVLRQSLARQKIPPPQGAVSWKNASWRDALLWAAAGKSGWIANSMYFPARRQVEAMVKILKQQGIDEQNPDDFLQGLGYARVMLKMPPNTRILTPPAFIHSGRGALLAPLEIASLHGALAHRFNLLPEPLYWTAYEYPDALSLNLAEAQEYVVLARKLGLEVLKEPALRKTVLEQLDKMISGNRLRAITSLLKNNEMSLLLRRISPLEQFRLGRALADDPNTESLPAGQKLRSLLGEIVVRGTPAAAFQSEVEELLRLNAPMSNSVQDTEWGPDGGDATEALRRSSTGDQLGAAQELLGSMIVQLLGVMQKEGISSNVLPYLLPKAAEFIKLQSGARDARSQTDVSSFKAVRQITESKVLLWVYELEQEGVREGDSLDWGLTRRAASSLLERKPSEEDADAGKPGARMGPRRPTLSFPAVMETDLKTYKHGTFRVIRPESNPDAMYHDPLESGQNTTKMISKELYYESIKPGDEITVTLTNRGSRKKLYVAKVVSIERKKLGALTLDDLQTEGYSPSLIWNALSSSQSNRSRFISDMKKSLSGIYGEDVSEETEGYMIIFERLPESRFPAPKR